MNGEWVASESGALFENRNSADPDDVVGEYQRSSAADVEAPIEAADAAGDEWAGSPAPGRGRILRTVGAALDDRSDELTETLVREEGKARSEELS